MKKLIIPLLLLLGACSPEGKYWNELPAIVTSVDKAKIEGKCWYEAYNIDQTYGSHMITVLDNIGRYKIGDTLKLAK